MSEVRVVADRVLRERGGWWGCYMRFGPDSIDRRPGGWWFRIGGGVGPGLSYRYINYGRGYHPPFPERFGLDRSVAIRFGPHLFTFLRPRWGKR